MFATLVAKSIPAAAPFGQKADVIARFVGWIRRGRDAHCVAALDPRLAVDAGLSSGFAWRSERVMIDHAAVMATEICGDRHMARQVLELGHPGVLADFQHAGRSRSGAKQAPTRTSLCASVSIQSSDFRP
jgi:hypothetical protein